jgi:poly(3-hydroxybutyrate) depolymerase
MNIYRPNPAFDNEQQRPLVLMIHGGGFAGGSLNEMNFMCNEFAKRGYVAATISYRLGWGCPSDAGVFLCNICTPLAPNIRTAAYNAIQDAHAALRFLVSNEATYGIEPDYIFVGGQSAGAITALGTAFITQEEANVYMPNGLAASGGLFNSGNELEASYTIVGVFNDCGAVPSVSVLDEGIPVINFHDDGDCVVPYANGYLLGCFGCTSFPSAQGSSLIYQHLASMEVCTALNTKQLSLEHCSWPQLSLVKRSACFAKQLMCGVCATYTNYDSVIQAPCSAMGLNESPGAPCPADMNGDFTVNVSDLLAFLGYFGLDCAP